MSTSASVAFAGVVSVQPSGAPAADTRPAPPASTADSSTLVRRAAALAASARARALVYAGNLGAASAAVDTAITMDPLNAAAYTVRARLRIGRGEVRDAWTDIELAARTGARWEALALTTTLKAAELGPAVARARLMPEVRAALTPRRSLEAERAVALAAALAQVGDTATALTLLELAATPDGRLASLLADPLLRPLQASRRFLEVRTRAGR